MPITGDLATGLLHMTTSELQLTGRAGTNWNLALPVDESMTIDNVLVGFSVHILDGPYASLADAVNVCLERLLIHWTVGGAYAV